MFPLINFQNGINLYEQKHYEIKHKKILIFIAKQ